MCGPYQKDEDEDESEDRRGRFGEDEMGRKRDEQQVDDSRDSGTPSGVKLK